MRNRATNHMIQITRTTEKNRSTFFITKLWLASSRGSDVFFIKSDRRYITHVTSKGSDVPPTYETLRKCDSRITGVGTVYKDNVVPFRLLRWPTQRWHYSLLRKIKRRRKYFTSNPTGLYFPYFEYNLRQLNSTACKNAVKRSFPESYTN